jgi:dTMP kinase
MGQFLLLSKSASLSTARLAITLRMRAPESSSSGALIVIEGIDGTGTSTLIGGLAEVCKARGLPFVTSREPTHGPYGKRLRDSAAHVRLELKEELELFLKDRAEHVKEIIAPALADGKIVLLDRYYLSTAAYQGARGADPEAILKMNERFAPVPDLVLLLDADPNVSGRRIIHRAGQTDAFEDAAYQAAVRRIFLSLKRPFIRVIDASRSPAEVLAECLPHFIAVIEKMKRG